MELTKRITQDGREEFYDIIPSDHKAYCKECVCHNVIGGKVVCRSDKLCNVKHEISIREKKAKEEEEKKKKEAEEKTENKDDVKMKDATKPEEPKKEEPKKEEKKDPDAMDVE